MAYGHSDKVCKKISPRAYAEFEKGVIRYNTIIAMLTALLRSGKITGEEWYLYESILAKQKGFAKNSLYRVFEPNEM